MTFLYEYSGPVDCLGRMGALQSFMARTVIPCLFDVLRNGDNGKLGLARPTWVIFGATSGEACLDQNRYPPAYSAVAALLRMGASGGSRSGRKLAPSVAPIR